jgi:hypothetical protein
MHLKITSYNAASRHYPLYNTTVTWCRPNTLNPHTILFGSIFAYCMKRSLFGDQTDPRDHYIIFAIGAWYKPRAFPHKKIDYDRALDQRVEALQKDLLHARELVSSQGKKGTKVVWRLNPHVGLADELNALGVGRKNVPAHVSRSGVWDEPRDDAKWTAAFNEVTRAIAATYGDLVLVRKPTVVNGE